MRNWMADKLESLACRIRGGDSEVWGALVSDGDIIVRRGQPIQITVTNDGATLSVDELTARVARSIWEAEAAAARDFRHVA